ncbi:MAG: hypothetical protein ACI4KM_05580 [Oscillospiraceae bacterium]
MTAYEYLDTYTRKFAYSLGYDYTEEISYDYLSFLKNTEVIFDADMESWDATARRPYYQLRGKSLTEEQALDILWKTSSLQTNDDNFSTLNFFNSWFCPNYFPNSNFWVHPDGTVGINGILSKYPNAVEMIDDWCRYLMHFPYLDLVMGITAWDELPPYGWDELFNSTDSYDKFPVYNDFLDNLEAGVWVHDGKIELMSAKRTKKIYKQYEKMYPTNDVRKYSQHYYSELRPEVEPELLKKLLALHGE